jgi:hypothetical protein
MHFRNASRPTLAVHRRLGTVLCHSFIDADKSNLAVAWKQHTPNGLGLESHGRTRLARGRVSKEACGHPAGQTTLLTLTCGGQRTWPVCPTAPLSPQPYSVVLSHLAVSARHLFTPTAEAVGRCQQRRSGSGNVAREVCFSLNAPYAATPEQ